MLRHAPVTMSTLKRAYTTIQPHAKTNAPAICSRKSSDVPGSECSFHTGLPIIVNSSRALHSLSVSSSPTFAIRFWVRYKTRSFGWGAQEGGWEGRETRLSIFNGCGGTHRLTAVDEHAVYTSGFCRRSTPGRNNCDKCLFFLQSNAVAVRLSLLLAHTNFSAPFTFWRRL